VTQGTQNPGGVRRGSLARLRINGRHLALRFAGEAVYWTYAPSFEGVSIALTRTKTLQALLG
jgi:hypothetical protein